MNRHSIIQKLNEFLQWIIVGIVGLGILMIYSVLRADGFNIYILLIGIICSVVPLTILFIRIRIDDKKSNKFIKQEVNRLKATGESIKIDLTKCEVKSSNWTTEEERNYIPTIQMWNVIGGESELNVKTVNHNMSRIYFEFLKDNKRIKMISEPIAKDEHTLKMLLEYQQTTNIYFDKVDQDKYFVDLDFLKN